MHHPHVHCVIPAGGVAADASRWVHPRPGFFLPVRILSEVFRGKFHAALKNLFRKHKLQFHGSLASLAQPKIFAKFLRQLFRQNWVVYAKRPFGGPEQCTALPRALHAPGRHLEPSAAQVQLLEDCTGYITYRVQGTGAPAPLPGTGVEKIVMLEDGDEIRSLTLQSPLGKVITPGVFRRISRDVR